MCIRLCKPCVVHQTGHQARCEGRPTPSQPGTLPTPAAAAHASAAVLIVPAPPVQQVGSGSCAPSRPCAWTIGTHAQAGASVRPAVRPAYARTVTAAGRRCATSTTTATPSWSAPPSSRASRPPSSGQLAVVRLAGWKVVVVADRQLLSPPTRRTAPFQGVFCNRCNQWLLFPPLPPPSLHALLNAPGPGLAPLKSSSQLTTRRVRLRGRAAGVTGLPVLLACVRVGLSDQHESGRSGRESFGTGFVLHGACSKDGQDGAPRRQMGALGWASCAGAPRQAATA